MIDKDDTKNAYVSEAVEKIPNKRLSQTIFVCYSLHIYNISVK